MSAENIYYDAFFGEDDEELMRSLADYDELTHPRKFLSWQEICNGETWESKYGEEL